jgi:ribosomal protein S18 acetylase RimI-like enzyme
MTEYSLRAATAADIPLLYRSELAYMSAVEPESLAGWMGAIDLNLELWVSNLDRGTVVEVGGEAAGILLWAAESGDSAVIVTVHVLPAFRRRGLARALLEEASDAARRQGLATVTLGVHELNPARALYEMAGFTATNTDGAYLFYSRPTLARQWRDAAVSEK